MPKLLLSQHIDHFYRFFQNRLASGKINGKTLDFPKATKCKSPYATFLKKQKCSTEEITIILLSLIPHVRPDFFHKLFALYKPTPDILPQLGGIKDHTEQYFLPTGETAIFLLAGDNLELRFKIQHLFSQDHWFNKLKAIYLESTKEGEPLLSGRIILDSEYLELFTIGKNTLPALSMQFPAKHISTTLTWDDLVLPKNTSRQIKELHRWVEHNDALMSDWEMRGKVKPGYRALFYGPPGTGKTLTASLLGKATNKDVFRIDLSMIVSKYIGETEKNLSRLFDKAENKNWILFFDEADALFGKRTDIRDAHDKYANQEVSYLLQRIENFDGLTILASNFKDNLDDAFTRRFQSIIYFPMPKANERFLLWTKAFPKQVDTQQIDFEKMAEQFELTGSNIINIVQYVSLQLLDLQTNILSPQLLTQAIYREYTKEGKLI